MKDGITKETDTSPYSKTYDSQGLWHHTPRGSDPAGRAERDRTLPGLQRLAYNMPKRIFADWLNEQISQQAIVLRGTPFPEQGLAYVLLLHAPDQDFPTVALQWGWACKCLSHVTGRLEHSIGSRCLYLVIHHVLKSNTSQYKPQLVKSSLTILCKQFLHVSTACAVWQKHLLKTLSSSPPNPGPFLTLYIPRELGSNHARVSVSPTGIVLSGWNVKSLSTKGHQGTVGDRRYLEKGRFSEGLSPSSLRGGATLTFLGQGAVFLVLDGSGFFPSFRNPWCLQSLSNPQ